MQIDLEILSTITSFFAIVGTIIGLVIAVRKAPFEMRESDSKAANAVAETISTLWEPLNERIKCLEGENLVVKKLNDEIKTALSTIEKENESMQETIADITEENKTLQNGLIELKSLNEEMCKQNDEMKKHLAEMEQRISELEKERDTIRLERDEIKAGAHKLVKQLRDMNPDTKPVYMPPEK